MEIVKIGSVELTPGECEKLITNKKRYIVTYSRIYVLEYSKNAGYHGRDIYIKTSPGGFTRRGRFYTYTAGEVNHLLGFGLLKED